MNLINKKNLIKHFNNIIGKQLTRPILNTINYDESTKRISATDSYRLLSIYDETIEKSFNINPNTLEINKMEYPNITRLLLEQKLTYFKKDNLTKEHLTFLKSLKENEIKNVYTEDCWKIYYNELQIFEIPLYENTNNETIEIYMNAKYLTQAIDFIMNATIQNEVNITYTNPLRPIAFITNDYQYIITPIRKNITPIRKNN